VWVCVYTGCPISTFTPKYLKMYKRNEKMFQTKVVEFEGVHKRVDLTLIGAVRPTNYGKIGESENFV